MQEGIRVVLPTLLSHRQTIGDQRERTLGVPRVGFKLGKQDQVPGNSQLNSLGL